MSFMVIAVAMLAAFCLQFLFQMVQMKSFNKFYTKLRKKGRVAIGKAKGGFMQVRSLCLRSIRME
mgnify:CR=1 FL=1